MVKVTAQPDCSGASRLISARGDAFHLDCFCCESLLFNDTDRWDWSALRSNNTKSFSRNPDLVTRGNPHSSFWAAWRGNYFLSMALNRISVQSKPFSGFFEPFLEIVKIEQNRHSTEIQHIALCKQRKCIFKRRNTIQQKNKSILYITIHCCYLTILSCLCRRSKCRPYIWCWVKTLYLLHDPLC